MLIAYVTQIGSHCDAVRHYALSVPLHSYTNILVFILCLLIVITSGTAVALCLVSVSTGRARGKDTPLVFCLGHEVYCMASTYVWLKRRREVVCPTIEVASALVAQYGGRVLHQDGQDTPSMANAISPIYQRPMGHHSPRRTGWDAVRRIEHRTGSKVAGRVLKIT
jgi:hypothetical protein